MSIGKRVAKNVFSNWANLAVNIVISFFLAPFIVKSLGNTWYGIWVIMMQFTGYLYLLDFGVRESVIRYVSKFLASKESESLDEILSASLLFYSGIGFIALAVSTALAFGFSSIFNVDPDVVPVAKIVIVLAGLTIGQTLAFNVYTGVVMGLQRYDIFNKIGIVFAFIRLALILVFLNLGYGILALAIIQLVIGLGNNLLIYRASKILLGEHGYQLRYKHRPLREQIPVFRSLYNYSVHVVVNNLGQKAIFYTDALIIGVFMNAASVTFYAIAGNLIEYLRRLILISNTVLNPLVSELETKKDTAAIQTVLMQGGRLSMLMALPIAAIYLTMGRQFIGHWMGYEYAALSGDVLFILAVSVALSTPQNTISSILYGISRHKIIANLRIVEAIANFAISIVLVQSLGIIGVALGTAIPQIVIMTIVLPLMVLRLLKLPVGKYVLETYVRPVAATAPFAAACYAVNTYIPASSLLTLMVQFALLGPVYLAGAWFIALHTRERRQYGQVLRSYLPALS
ncbi:oligosaccharide flippase family protein [Woeseia oceani]|uniref:Uncharacterized protein n=1 Tax=Woeseia oceani TaxID=1548547 RepID=A0A193LEL4_9GAMM|nr:polysaccharide biosynthesis C-terminal domain-containing protein [Woeseia oceani]ANO50970.1 hypothetical protein BA177_06885 [Woeseia oceani]